MDATRELEEKLREASCIGDEESIRNLILSGVNVNSQNAMNGWTALHWAAKRGHKTTVDLLLSYGAKKDILNSNGDAPGNLSSDTEICATLDGNPQSQDSQNGQLPFVPNYLANPQFPHVRDSSGTQYTPVLNKTETYRAVPLQNKPPTDPDELVLKARVANSAERDFIEVEMERKRLSFENLMSVLCGELQVNRTLVQKIRKLPDTIIRKDKDVQRLQDFQEVELVLTTKAISESSRNYSASVAPRHVDVVY